MFVSAPQVGRIVLGLNLKVFNGGESAFARGDMEKPVSDLPEGHDIYYLAKSARYWSVCVGVSLRQERRGASDKSN